MTPGAKLEKFAEREFRRNLSSMIIEHSPGNYLVFENYMLTQQPYGYLVSTYNQDIHCFGSKRVAVSWCVADKYSQYKLASNILMLDRKKQTLTDDVQCRQGVAKKSKSDNFYEIINMKVQPKLSQLNSVSMELERCVSSAKYMQIRGFLNETARTSGATAQ